MRQLKFRQWQKATKHYVYFSLSNGVSLKFNIEPDLEQYTGLKDKNGKYTRDNVKSWLEMYEVIGNIHENPELLEQGNAKD